MTTILVTIVPESHNELTVPHLGNFLTDNFCFFSFCNPPPFSPCVNDASHRLLSTDLVFIEDGNKLWVQDQIHFYKCYMVAEIIQQIQQYQQTPYNLTPVKPIKDFLRNIKPLSEDDCWNLSLVIKPQRKPGTK